MNIFSFPKLSPKQAPVSERNPRVDAIALTLQEITGTPGMHSLIELQARKWRDRGVDLDFIEKRRQKPGSNLLTPLLDTFLYVQNGYPVLAPGAEQAFRTVGYRLFPDWIARTGIALSAELMSKSRDETFESTEGRRRKENERDRFGSARQAAQIE